MKTELVTAPTSYPVTLIEAMNHLRVMPGDDGIYIVDLIKVATEYVEDMCSNRFVEQTWNVYLDEFPEDSFITLPFGKVMSVTSLKYTDYEGSETTWDSSNYSVDTIDSPGNLDLAYGKSWPSVTLQPVNGIVIEFVTGYSTVPYKIKQAILLYISHLFENREPFIVNQIGISSVTKLPLAIDALVADYRMIRFG